MNKMNRALIHRAAWMAGVLLLGLLLSSCGPASPAGKDPEGTRDQGEGTAGAPGEVNQGEEATPNDQEGSSGENPQEGATPDDQGEGTAQGSQGEEAAPNDQGEEAAQGSQGGASGENPQEGMPGENPQVGATPDDQGEGTAQGSQEEVAAGITDLIGVWKSATTISDNAFYDIEIFYKVEFFEETITNTTHVSLKIKGTETISEDTGVETYSISRIDGANIHVVLTQKTRSKLAGSGNARQQIGDSYSIHVERNGDSLEIRWYDEHPEHNEPVSYTKEES